MKTVPEKMKPGKGMQIKNYMHDVETKVTMES